MKMSKLFTMALISALIISSNCAYNQIQEITGLSSFVTGQATNADGSIYAASTYGSNVYIFSIGKQFTLEQTLSDVAAQSFDLSLSDDASTLVTFDNSGVVRIYTKDASSVQYSSLQNVTGTGAL